MPIFAANSYHNLITLVQFSSCADILLVSAKNMIYIAWYRGVHYNANPHCQPVYDLQVI